MAYVPVPKDLSKIKTKLAFNLTKRQLVCFSSAAAVGLPAYLFSRGSIGNSAAMFLMIGLMLPFFFQTTRSCSAKIRTEWWNMPRTRC